ncbi:MAG: TrkH family potassium uptake protein [Lachnospiraceae bacterium]|nr:TrkH family potassium uptake protein [Lachnospiraceae bacterium]
MNYKMIRYILGRMLGIEGVVLLIPMLVSLIYREGCWKYFLFTSILLFIIALLNGRKTPEQSHIYGKEGFVIVGFAWILWSLFGALPFTLSGSIPFYLDAVFETISGFTTTGSTILSEIEGLPYGILFWRNLTHWIGGMGVLVFVLMLTTLNDKNAMHLMRAEVPGPDKDKMIPKARENAMLLYMMYFALTVAEIILLKLGGMTLYDSIVHAFSTAGTGGFSTKNSSIAYYDSAYIDGVITIFMILFGVNFNMYFLILIRDIKSVFKNEELRVYLGIVASTIVLITVNITHMYGSVIKAFRYASFQVASVISTTGFMTADFDLWPEFSKSILLMIMLIGACGGSTGGGMKVSRIMIIAKSIKREVKQLLHPRSVNITMVNGKRVSDDSIRGLYIYVFAYSIIIVLSTIVVSLDNYDFGTTFTSVLTTLNNVGPGISKVGPTCNFSFFSPLSKIVLCMDMLVGRLEIFPFLMICSPSLWRKKF